jgi:glycosyltransferase involved in cell wall biosynthesis
MEKALKARARPNIRFVSHLDFAQLRQTYARARALVMTAEEDFGLTPVEAMASGRPVVGLGRGGWSTAWCPTARGFCLRGRRSMI